MTLADRSLRLVASSVTFHLGFAWPEYVGFRLVRDAAASDTARFAASWCAVLVLLGVPALVCTALGGAVLHSRLPSGLVPDPQTAPRGSRGPAAGAGVGQDTCPAGLGRLFSDRPPTYLRVRTTSGDWLAGHFADLSYAGGFPHEADLFLEEAWEVSDDDEVVLERPLGYALYIPAQQIAWLELISEETRHGVR